MIKYLLHPFGFIGSLMLMLTACSSESSIDGGGEEKDLVVSAEIVSSGIDSKALSEDYDKRAFKEDDQIKISRTSDATAVNYTKTGTRWMPTAGSMTIDGTNQTFTAIYPHNFSMILEDQTDSGTNTGTNFRQSNQLKSDVTTASNYVAFRFAPAFAKITVSVDYNTSVRQGVTASIEGTGLRTGSDTETINLLRTSQDGLKQRHTFTCILYPGQRGFKLTVTGQISANGSGSTTTDEQTYKQANKTFASGYNYIYNFTSSNNLILNGITVEPFSGGNINDVGSAT